MCNKLHKFYNIPIEQTGVGYKLFSILQGEIELRTLVRATRYRGYDFRKMDPDSYGFCFFFTKEEAKKALMEWKETQTGAYQLMIGKIVFVIRKIRYFECIEQMEDKFCGNLEWRIGLTPKFEIIED